MRILTLLIGVVLLCHSVIAQKQVTEKKYNCDAMLGILDNVAKAGSESHGESVVIIVAYLGESERSNLYNEQRLKAAETYLTQKRGFPKVRLILTEGKKRNGLGKVEFYVGGKLSAELFLDKKGRICTGCCPAEFETKTSNVVEGFDLIHEVWAKQVSPTVIKCLLAVNP